MATGIGGHIEAALNAHLLTLTLAPPLPVVSQNRTFAPPRDGWYLRANSIGLPPDWWAITKGSSRYTGLFQVDVVFPENVGMVKPRDVAAAVAAHFKRGTSLVSGPVRVNITRPPYDGPVLENAGGFMIPVTINYSSINANPA